MNATSTLFFFVATVGATVWSWMLHVRLLKERKKVERLQGVIVTMSMFALQAQKQTNSAREAIREQRRRGDTPDLIDAEHWSAQARDSAEFIQAHARMELDK